MRKNLIYMVMLTSIFQASAQQNPTNNNPSVPSQNGINDRAFWSRAGNNPVNGTNNIFGTLWNSSIYIQTNGLNRGAFFATQGSLAPAWVNPLPSGGGMSINFNPAAPIRNPLSLLHIRRDILKFLKKTQIKLSCVCLKS